MKKAGFFIVLVAGIIVFKACVERKDVSDICGTWSLEKTEIFIEDDLKATNNDTGEKLTFYRDGSGRSGVFIFEWELNGDTLLISEHGYTDKYYIRKKEKNRMILEHLRIEQDPSGETEILTLSR